MMRSTTNGVALRTATSSPTATGMNTIPLAVASLSSPPDQPDPLGRPGGLHLPFRLHGPRHPHLQVPGHAGAQSGTFHNSHGVWSPVGHLARRPAAATACSRAAQMGRLTRTPNRGTAKNLLKCRAFLTLHDPDGGAEAGSLDASIGIFLKVAFYTTFNWTRYADGNATLVTCEFNGDVRRGFLAFVWRGS